MEIFTGQVLHSLKVEKIKGIQNLKNIDFSPHPVTAILGPNGSGKSTLLHIISCLYQPLHIDPNDENKTLGENHRLVDFFPISPDSEWNGTGFEVNLTHRKDKALIDKRDFEYGKSQKKGSRWLEIYARRPEREVYYLGIDKCVPLIESEKRGLVKFVTSELSDDLSLKIKDSASFILNKRYMSINNHVQPNGKSMIGVSCNGVSYSSLSMSAGEQKIFQILSVVFGARKNALIVIDELDLLLHDIAFKRLVEVISSRARDKNLQIIFTTHRESVIELSSKVNIRHILNLGDVTYCFPDTKPDAINRLTGGKISSVEVYVEDDVAASIIRKVCSSMQASKHINIIRYGAAINSFTLVCASLLRNDDLDKVLYVLDGDEYKKEEDKVKCIDRVLTGNDQRAIDLRSKALNHIRQFNLPDGHNPEKFIHSILEQLNPNDFDADEPEIIDAAKNIQFELDKHNYLDQIIITLGLDRSSALTRMIDLASKSERWEEFVSGITDYLSPILLSLKEDTH